MLLRATRTGLLFLMLLALDVAAGQAASAPSIAACNAGIARGIAYRQLGSIRLAVDTLAAAHDIAITDEQRARAAAELGAALLLAHRHDQAAAAFMEAYALQRGVERARTAVDLGNLALARKDPQAAHAYFNEAKSLAAGDPQIVTIAALNQARLLPAAERLPALRSLSADVATIDGIGTRCRVRINLAHQAHALGPAGLELAFGNLDAARRELAAADEPRLLAEALDALAQLYEDQGRRSEATILTRQALVSVERLEPGAAAELRLGLEWRLGRLLEHGQQPDAALAAFERAAEQLEAIRQDLPIEYEDGRSSYSATIEPLYQGLLGLLLGGAEQQPPAMRAAYLRRARDSVELLRQAEMQDFLGDRCSVESVQDPTLRRRLPPGTAVLRTVALGEHAELLLETAEGLERHRVAVDSATLQRTARRFADQLRTGESGYEGDARQLYDWLIRPFETHIEASRTRTLVVVPDGPLRLIAIGALHDGKRFAIEKYAIASATGMTMTHTAAPQTDPVRALVAGLAHPGPVVRKLAGRPIGQSIVGAAPRGLAGSLRSLRSPAGGEAGSGDDAAARALAAGSESRLSLALALPGVSDEVESIGGILHGTRLLDERFTVGGFSGEAESGGYRILHIASHGMFGGNAESSFILAYDDLLTLDGLQALLKSEKLRKTPIELLTLSACQTAEGNERAPLGISGAAIKARARSVLGTLWPVEDHAARLLMAEFYAGLASRGLGKGEALRQAQLTLARTAGFGHPFFWAPFTLIGNWQ